MKIIEQGGINMPAISFFKKGLAIGILLLFLGPGVVPSNGQRKDAVSLPMARGNTLYVGGSGPGNYTSIQAAINDAHDGDTVAVYDDSSPYYEHVIVDTQLYLVGEDQNTTVIDGSHTGDVVTITSDGVDIQGFTMQHSGTNAEGLYESGVKLIDCTDSCIHTCVFREDAVGVCFYNASETTVARCSMLTNIEGITFTSDDWNPGTNCYNKILWNTVQYNSYGGVSFRHTWYHHSDNLIIGNNISYNGDGITLITAEDNEIAYNEFYENDGVGVGLTRCDCGGEGNTVHKNNFILNNGGSTQGGDTGWGTNFWDGNYWSDYNGSDNDGDGIGDTPYALLGDSGAQDHTPFMDFADQHNQEPTAPTISGPHEGKTRKYYRYTFHSSDPNDDDLFYDVDWGDGTSDRYVSPPLPGQAVTLWHRWMIPDYYVIAVKAIDGWGQDSIWSGLVVTITKKTPTPPTIVGTTQGKAGVNYTYNVTSIDPEEDFIYYYIDWGDGTNSAWLGPYWSGQTSTTSHTWEKKGSYQMKAKAKDQYDNEGAWSTLTITMPTPAFSQSILLGLLERFPHAFPILRHLMNG